MAFVRELGDNRTLELADVALSSSRGGLLLMLVCYLDESGDKQTDQLVMAGFISSTEKWRRFERYWKRVLAEYRVPYLHMNEYAHSKGPFSGWDRARREAFIKQVLWIIKTYTLSSIATVISPADYYAVYGKKNKADNPYTFGFCSCLSAALMYCAKHKCLEDIAVVLDTTSENKGNLVGYFLRFRESEDIPHRSQLVSLKLADDKRMLPLQAADFLAYEFLKYARGFERESLRAFIRGARGTFTHWTRERLEECFAMNHKATLKKAGGEAFSSCS